MAPKRVILIGTVSKTLAPALRLGWILAPDLLINDLTDAKQRADRGSSILEQEALAALIRSGRYDRHLRAMRKRYMARRDLLVALLTTSPTPSTGQRAGRRTQPRPAPARRP